MQKSKMSDAEDCEKCIMLVKDSLDVLNGRWKLPILVSLKFGDKRFKQISRDLEWNNRQDALKGIKGIRSEPVD